MRKPTGTVATTGASPVPVDVYQTLFESLDRGFCIVELLYDARGHAVDYRFQDVNPVFEQQTGMAGVVGKRATEVAPNVGQAWIDTVARVAQTGTPLRTEAYFEDPDRWYAIAMARLGDSGSPLVASVFDDITERKTAEARLRESEDRLRLFVMASSDTVYRMSPDWHEMRALDGGSFLTDTASPSRSWLETYIPDSDQAAVQAAIDRAIRTKTTFELEHRVLRADGTAGWTASKAIPLLGSGGTITEWLGAASDITERKEAEKRQQFLLLLSDALRPLTDPAEVEAVLTATALAYFGADRCYYCTIDAERAVIRRDASRDGLPSVAGTYLLASFPLLKTALETGRPFKVPDVRTSSVIDEALRQLCIQLQVISFLNIPVTKNGTVVGELCLVQSTPRDWADVEVALAVETAERTWAAVERARAGEALRASEVKYRTLFNSMDDGYCIIQLLYDAAGAPCNWRYLEVNPAFEKTNGLAGATGKTILDLAPGIEPKWFAVYGAVAATGLPVRLEDYSDAFQSWFSLYAFRVGTPEDAQVAVLFNDITERRRAEETVRQAEARHRATLEAEVALRTSELKGVNDLLGAVTRATPDIIYVLDLRARRTVYRNHAIGRVLGYTEAQLAPLREPLLDLMYEPDLLRMLAHLKDLETAADGEVREIQYRLKAADGSLRWYVDRNAVFARDGVGVPTEKIGISQDISARKQGEAELYKHLSILQQAEDVAGAGSWEWDGTAHTLRWSDGLYRLFGISPGTAVLPEVYLDRAVAGSRAAAHRVIRALRHGTRPFEETVTIALPGGGERVLKVKGVSFDDAFGQPTKRLGVGLDITSDVALRRSLEERLHFIETLSNALPDRVAVLDRERRFVAWNQRCEEAYGLRPAEVVGRALAEVFPKLDTGPVNAALAAALHGDFVLHEAQQAAVASGYFDVYLIPIWRTPEDAAPSSVLVILHDVTERVRTTEALKGQHRALEGAYSELTTFTKIASHDLKEPLRKIYTFIEMLLRQEAGKLSNSGRATFRRIQTAVQRMGLLTDDIATFSELSTWRGKRAPADLNAIVADALEALQPALAQADAAVTVAEPLPVVPGYAPLLEQLFRQLLSNAVKFQPKDAGHVPAVAIRWEWGTGPVPAQKAGEVREYCAITLADNGIGFDPAYAERIFGMFQRLHPEGEYKGSGMGLAVARKVAELHGGTVTATAEPGRGASFTVYLPVADRDSGPDHTTTIS